MVTALRIGPDDFLLVRWSDIVRIRDRDHAERLLGDQRLVLEDERERVLDRLAEGDIILVRTERPRPILARGHGYSILDYRDGVALVRNPWGGKKGGIEGQPMKDGVFEMPLPFFLANFRNIAIER